MSVVPSKTARVSLSEKQLSDNETASLCVMLIELSSDGHISDGEIRDLDVWVQQTRKTNALPALAFLGDVLHAVLQDGRIEESERAELHHAILRVLPPKAREAAKEQKRIAIKKARDVINAERDKATERQLQYIEDLGGDAEQDLTKSQASELINSLLEFSPTVRQRMVLRFWDRLDLLEKGKDAVSDWMDEWYAEDENHLLAWELWKEENGDMGERDSYLMELVPVGIGYEYLTRLNAKAPRASGGCMGLILGFMLVCATLAKGITALA